MPFLTSIPAYLSCRSVLKLQHLKRCLLPVPHSGSLCWRLRGGKPRERKMLEGHLPRVINHQVYKYTKTKSQPLQTLNSSCLCLTWVEFLYLSCRSILRSHHFKRCFLPVPCAGSLCWRLRGGVPREQKMLKGHLPRIMCHQVYKYTKTEPSPLKRYLFPAP